jgi:hypothetical protein
MVSVAKYEYENKAQSLSPTTTTSMTERVACCTSPVQRQASLLTQTMM